MAGIDGVMGKGLQGYNCNPSQSPNPVVNFGKPFGHAHKSDLEDLISYCDCGIYQTTTAWDLSSISCCHEVCLIYWYLTDVGTLVDGRQYEVRTRVVRGGIQTFHYTIYFTWDDSWSKYHGFSFWGWTPCFMWQGGSKYTPNTVEIDGNGSYTAYVELWDMYTNTKLDTYTRAHTISNLTHTVMTGTIQNYAGENVSGDIRIRSEYTLPAGCCSDGLNGYTGEVYYKRAADDNYDYSINVDGMEGLVRITPYHSGYKLKEIEFSGITAKDLNTGNNFTGTNYLPCTIQGVVTDPDTNTVENAMIYAFGGTNRYGAKTSSAGKYALPIHTDGYFVPKATKNNFGLKTGVNVTVTVNHPSSVSTQNFTLARQGAPTGAYAHLDSFCVDDQSVIIPDDPVTSSALIKASSVGATIVKTKTRKWGTGAAQCTTSTGTSNGGVGYGSGGSNYEGDTGDAEDWE